MLRLATLLALLLLGPAAALELEAVGPDAPLVPEVEEAVVPVTVTVDCQVLWAQEETTVLVEAAAEEALIVTGPTHAEFTRDDCAAPEGTTAQTLSYSISFTRDAVADEPLTVAFTARRPADAVHPGAEADATVQATPAYYGLAVVKIDQQIKETSNDRAEFEMTLENHGNGAARFMVEVAEAPDGVRVDLPEPFVLERGATRTVPFVVHGPDGSWGQFQARFRLNVTQEGTGADPQEYFTNILLRNGDALERVGAPAPGAPLLAVAVVAAAALARRR